VAAVSQLACTATFCIAAGVKLSGLPVYLVYSDATGTWSGPTNFPGAINTVTQVICTTDQCFALGADAGGNPLFTSYPSGSWTAPVGFPAGIVSVSQMACPDDSDCFATGSAGGSSSVLGLSSGAWSTVLPANLAAPTYTSGIACSDKNDCYVAAVSSSGDPEVLVGTRSWTLQSLPGIAANDATVSQVDLVPASGAPLVSEPVSPADLYYPNPTGYFLWAGGGSGAGSCAASPPAWQTPVLVIPGGNTKASPPMGLLAVLVVTPTGAPVPGATITATRTSCSGEGNVWPAGLTTGADGVAVIAAPPGTYALNVSLGAQNGPGSVQVSQNGSLSPVVVAD